MGDFALRGLDRSAWDQREEDDLAAIKPRLAPDPFSRWFTSSLIAFIHHFLGMRFKVGYFRMVYWELGTLMKTRSPIRAMLGMEYIHTKSQL